MSHFRRGEGDQGLSWGCLPMQASGGKMAGIVDANTNQKRIGQQHERHMTIPSDEASNLVLIQPKIFGCLQVFVG